MHKAGSGDGISFTCVRLDPRRSTFSRSIRCISQFTCQASEGGRSGGRSGVRRLLRIALGAACGTGCSAVAFTAETWDLGGRDWGPGSLWMGWEGLRLLIEYNQQARLVGRGLKETGGQVLRSDFREDSQKVVLRASGITVPPLGKHPGADCKVIESVRTSATCQTANCL